MLVDDQAIKMVNIVCGNTHTHAHMHACMELNRNGMGWVDESTVLFAKHQEQQWETFWCGVVCICTLLHKWPFINYKLNWVHGFQFRYVLIFGDLGCVSSIHLLRKRCFVQSNKHTILSANRLHFTNMIWPNLTEFMDFARRQLILWCLKLICDFGVVCIRCLVGIFRMRT